jgi:transcriptional regulator with XRE-family HTH domain
MNPIKQIIKQAKSSQKEVCEKMNVPQGTMSHRMNKDVRGTIEWSIEVAKELNVRTFKIVTDSYSITISIR